LTYQWDTAILREDAEGNEDEILISVFYEYTPGRVGSYWDPPECAELEIVSVEHNKKEFELTPDESERLEENCYLHHLSTLD